MELPEVSRALNDWQRMRAYNAELLAEQSRLLRQRDALKMALEDVLQDRLTQTNLHQMPPAMRARLEKARAILAEIR